MKRQVLDNGRWFDMNRAEVFNEKTRWDGRNRVSMATGDQFLHETLYRTAGGRWVLQHWSQWEGSRETWTEVTSAEAALWLARSEYEPHEACAEDFAALEI